MLRAFSSRIAIVVITVVLGLPSWPLSRAGGIVTSCDEASLRVALEGGGVVTLACDGVLTLAEPIVVTADTVIDGSGHTIAISGNHKVRVFEVVPGVRLEMLNVGVTQGRHSMGAGLYNRGGTVVLREVQFTGNEARGLEGSGDGHGRGGGIYNDQDGQLQVRRSRFADNLALGAAGLDGLEGGSGGSGLGAALFNLGSASVEDTVFADNHAVGGTGGSGTGVDEFGDAGSGGQGGAGAGGAVYSEGSLVVNRSTLMGNRATGTGGGTGGAGAEGGRGGHGGRGWGGGVANAAGSASITNCTFYANRAQGGQGGNGGDARSASGYGGDGGDGRGGSGGGLHSVAGTVTVSACTFSENRVVGAVGGTGGARTADAAGNHAGKAGLTRPGLGGSLMRTGGSVSAERSLFASRSSEANIGGTITDVGFNLSTDNSIGSGGSGGMIQTDPHLGPLADNGGPTPTLALLLGSPAIDAVTNGICGGVDQRGVSRPQGGNCDVGAFEGAIAGVNVDLQFEPEIIDPGEISLMQLTLHNPNATPLTGIAFTNVLPAGLWVADAPAAASTCTGQLLALPNRNLLVLTEATLGSDGRCTLVVPVTGLVPGPYTNGLSPLWTTEAGAGNLTNQTVLWLRGWPTVTTLPAVNDGIERVGMRAAINPRGLDTRYRFEFGLTTDYGQETSIREAGGGTEVVMVTEWISDLPAVTSYHYRVVAENAFGAAVGEDQTMVRPSKHSIYAVALDGESGFVATPDLAANFPTETITLELWFSALAPGVLVDERGQAPPSGGWQITVLEVLADGEVRGRFNGVGPVSLGKVGFGEWHHVALRYDRATLTLTGLLDGVPSAPVSGDRAAPTESGYKFYLAIGLADNSAMGARVNLPGTVDEIRLWNSARTDREIRENFDFRLSGTEPGLVAYWRADEGSGSALADGSGHGQIAKLVGGVSWTWSQAPLDVGRPPIVSILEPILAAYGSITLRAIVKPRGLDTTTYFEFGSATNYDSATVAEVIPGSEGERLVAATLTNLTAGIDYHGRVVASNRLGTFLGDDQLFRASTHALSAVRLNAGSDSLVTPNLTPFFPTETMTIELWFMAKAAGVLIDERGQLPPAEGWHTSLLEVLASGYVRARVHNLDYLTLGPITFGSWHHVALRYDKTTLAFDCLLDGILSTRKISGDRSAPPEFGYQTRFVFGLGDTYHMGSGAAFNGALDEVRIWNVARSDADIRAGSQHILLDVEDGLVCYWRCDEIVAERLPDSSGCGNDGSLLGQPSLVLSGAPLEVLAATTWAASDVGETSATLRGIAGQPSNGTVAFFEWGLTDAYGNQTAPQVVPEGPPATVSAVLTELSPGVRYHYRLTVQNAENLASGADHFFETPGDASGQALALDGADDALFSQDLRDRFVDETLTVELWFRADSHGVLLCEYGDVAPWYRWEISLLEVSSAGHLLARVHQVPVTDLGAVSFGEWHHAALRYDKASQKLQGFLDGVASPQSSGDRATPWASNLRAFYGFGLATTYNMGSGAAFRGQIDEIRIWNVARTGVQLLSNACRSLTGQEPGLIAYWRLDEGQGLVAHDASGHGSLANLLQGPVWEASTAPILRPDPVTRLTDGRVRLRFFGITPSRPMQLESSTDLRSWSPIQTNSPNTRAVLRFEDDTAADLPMRFYRLREGSP